MGGPQSQTVEIEGQIPPGVDGPVSQMGLLGSSSLSFVFLLPSPLPRADLGGTWLKGLTGASPISILKERESQ